MIITEEVPETRANSSSSTNTADNEKSDSLPYRQDFDDFDVVDRDPNTLLKSEKKERAVIRCLPAFIDFIILGIQLTIFVSYLYIAYFSPNFGEVACRADYNSDEPLGPQDAITGVDVSRQFRIAIRWGFWMSFLVFFRAILAQVGLYLKMWVLLYISYLLFAINISMTLSLIIFMQVWRWGHSGRVCAGDLRSKENSDDDQYYLLTEGKFIKAILIAMYCMLGLGCTSVAIITFSQSTSE